jgi:hypothetical protein
MDGTYQGNVDDSSQECHREDRLQMCADPFLKYDFIDSENDDIGSWRERRRF